MKIVDIKATAHHIEVPLPLFSTSVVTRRIVFAEVTTDEGQTVVEFLPQPGRKG